MALPGRELSPPSKNKNQYKFTKNTTAAQKISADRFMSSMLLELIHIVKKKCLVFISMHRIIFNMALTLLGTK